jgi:F-type H+-transporting ATPase subunit epsilon
MQLEVLTPRKIEFKEEVSSIVLPTIAGEITVLPGHASLVSILKPGVIRIKTSQKQASLQIEGGILEVAGNKAVILLQNFNIR